MERESRGGHNIPEETIVRRYQRGLDNFFQLYRPLADFWKIFNNANPKKPKQIAEGDGRIEKVDDASDWKLAQGSASQWTMDNAGIEAAMEEAIYDTLREHKLLGLPIVVWRDGKVVWVPPEEIELPEHKNGAAKTTT